MASTDHPAQAENLPACDHLFSELPFVNGVATAGDLDLQEPTLLSGVPSYRIIGGEWESDLFKAASLIDQKFGVPVFLQQNPRSGYYGYKSNLANLGYEAIVLNQMHSLSPDARLGVLWHEVAHTSVEAKLEKGLPTAALRSIEFNGSVGSPEFSKLGYLYAPMFRADELYAMAVQAGVHAKQAERALLEGDRERASAALNLVRPTIANGRGFAQAIKRHYQIFEENLKNPSLLRISREPNGKVRVNTQSVTVETQKTLGAGGKIISAERNIYHQHGLLLSMPGSESGPVTPADVEAFLAESKADVAKLLKILDAIEKRAGDIASKLP